LLPRHFPIKSILFRQLRSARQVSQFRIRSMASSASPTKHEWIIILPDQEGVLEQRMKVRPNHLSGLKPRVEDGFWTFGGAFLEEVPKEGEGPKIKGSIMLALAESKEEVLKELKKDTYTTSGVWDWDKVQIYPFKTALRKPL